MNIDVHCSALPTKRQADATYQLMLRTMRKAKLPLFSHSLVLSGSFASQAMAVFSHAGCNVALMRDQERAQYAVVVGGAPRGFMQDRKQVLVAPEGS